MKKTVFLILAAGLTAFGLSSCSFFEIDNYPAPQETIRGYITDVATGEPVLTEQNGNGIRVRLTELSYGENVTHNPDFYARDNGFYQHTKIFKGNYNVTVDGPFIPIVRKAPDGTLLYDGSVTCDIEGITEVHFRVQPFLKVEIVGTPVVKGGQIQAKVRVTRAVSPEAFRNAVEPTQSEYKDDQLNVTDLRLYVGYSSTCNSSNSYSGWSNQIDYPGAAFEPYLGQEVDITSRGTIKSNRKVFIRAAARINYATEGTRRYNYSEVVEVNIP